MSCTGVQTKFKGLSIELAEANISIGVTDVFGNIIENALVTLDCGFKVVNELTDANGCVRASLPDGIGCNITVSKDNYQLYQYKFEVVEKTLFDSTKNFAFKVENSSNAPVTGATVDMTYAVGGSSSNVSVNESSGIYEAEFKYGFTNTLNINAGGDGTYNKSIETFIKVECADSNYAVLPVIQVN